MKRKTKTVQKLTTPWLHRWANDYSLRGEPRFCVSRINQEFRIPVGDEPEKIRFTASRRPRAGSKRYYLRLRGNFSGTGFFVRWSTSRRGDSAPMFSGGIAHWLRRLGLRKPGVYPLWVSIETKSK